MPLTGYFVGLLVAILAITGSAAMGDGNVTAFEEKDANNIGGDGLSAMLHAVRKRQTEEGQGNAKTRHMDYVLGKWLTESDVKKVALFTQISEGILTFNADVPGPTKELRLNFLKKDTCSIDRKNGIFFLVEICKAQGTKGKCPDGAAFCFPGRLDPKNKDVEYSFELPNVNANVAKVCNNSAAKEKWEEWKNFAEIHTVLLTSIDGEVLEIDVSYMKEGTSNSVYKKGTAGEMIEFGDNGCVTLWVGTEEGLYGKIENDKQDPIQQNFADFWRLRQNGVPLCKMPFTSSLPPNVFVDTGGGAGPIFAFIGTEGCQFTIKIKGTNLKKCLDEKCEFQPEPEGPEALYWQDFKGLKPIFAPGEVPSSYRSSVTFEKDRKMGTPQAILSTQGNELYFGVATKTKQPPVLMLRYPNNGQYCTERANFKANQFVLAYNGRSDCNALFGWGQQKLQFVDTHGLENEELGRHDFPVYFRGYEVSVKGQFGDMKLMGRVRCPIEPQLPVQPLPNMPAHKYLWAFILNPKRGEDIPLPSTPRCSIPLLVNLTEYRLLFTA